MTESAQLPLYQPDPNLREPQFANTVSIDYPAVMFVGVRNDGTVQAGQVNLETLQRSISTQISKAYPEIYHFHRVLRDASGNPFLAVIVPGSAQRPHFAGQAYIRVGSDSKAASEPQFQNLIAQRQGKAYEILKWKGKQIRVNTFNSRGVPRTEHEVATLEQCTPYYVTYSVKTKVSSVPLAWTELSFDHSDSRLSLEIRLS